MIVKVIDVQNPKGRLMSWDDFTPIFELGRYRSYQLLNVNCEYTWACSGEKEAEGIARCCCGKVFGPACSACLKENKAARRANAITCNNCDTENYND